LLVKLVVLTFIRSHVAAALVLAVATHPDTTSKAPSSLEEVRNAFLAQKSKERKKDRTPLEEDTIRGYEWLTRDFIDLTKCQFPWPHYR